MIDILRRIEEMRLERNWSMYELSKHADISQSTISSWYQKNQLPTLRLLEKVSQAFDITLSMMIAEENATELSSQEQYILNLFQCLDSDQRNNLLLLVKRFSRNSE